MNVDTIAGAVDKERDKSTHCVLDDDFYDDVAEYLAGVESEDELRRAEDKLEALIDRRQGKTIKQASFASTGYPVDTDCMTTSEKALFEDLTERLEQHRDQLTP